MTPTCKLRFVQRPFTIKADAFTQQPERIAHSMILQQMWEVTEQPYPSMTVTRGVWRDVPIETE